MQQAHHHSSVLLSPCASKPPVWLKTSITYVKLIRKGIYELYIILHCRVRTHISLTYVALFDQAGGCAKYDSLCPLARLSSLTRSKYDRSHVKRILLKEVIKFEFIFNEWISRMRMQWPELWLETLCPQFVISLCFFNYQYAVESWNITFIFAKIKLIEHVSGINVVRLIPYILMQNQNARFVFNGEIDKVRFGDPHDLAQLFEIPPLSLLYTIIQTGDEHCRLHNNCW